MRLLPGLGLGLLLAIACGEVARPRPDHGLDPSERTEADARAEAPLASAPPSVTPPDPRSAPAGEAPDQRTNTNTASKDPMAGHAETQDQLLALLDLHPAVVQGRNANAADETTLKTLFNVTSASAGNQGNRALSLHTISKYQCMEGLKNIVLQTPEQRSICGADFMVPVHKRGEKARTCVDIFEFPNKPCELPVVWTPPVFAEKVCKMQGKRLCTQDEWQVACRGAPDDAPDRPFAYGDKLDLDICHTNRPHRQRCDVTSSGAAWKSCTTDTEPTGSFPGCRSRFGVFDQHGNVAEIMTRKDPERGIATQLKGSAWFYTEVAPQPGRKQETYPDTCNFDPRWHVETLSHGFHVNYHLGFRCCKGIDEATSSKP